MNWLVRDIKLQFFLRMGKTVRRTIGFRLGSVWSMFRSIWSWLRSIGSRLVVIRSGLVVIRSGFMVIRKRLMVIGSRFMIVREWLMIIIMRSWVRGTMKLRVVTERQAILVWKWLAEWLKMVLHERLMMVIDFWVRLVVIREWLVIVIMRLRVRRTVRLWLLVRGRLGSIRSMLRTIWCWLMIIGSWLVIIRKRLVIVIMRLRGRRTVRLWLLVRGRLGSVRSMLRSIWCWLVIIRSWLMVVRKRLMVIVRVRSGMRRTIRLWLLVRSMLGSVRSWLVIVRMFVR